MNRFIFAIKLDCNKGFTQIKDRDYDLAFIIHADNSSPSFGSFISNSQRWHSSSLIL